MRALTVMVLLPMLLGAKCIPYDPAFAPVGTDGEALVGAGDAVPPTPAVPCETAGEARLRVREFEYSILCGCAEVPWSDIDQSATCTVAAGTTVIWSFAGSEEHNVAASDFEDSADRIFGQHRTVFNERGVFDYACSLHPARMSGYSIVVR